MSGTFRGASTFDADISSWVVSSVTDMRGMFRGAAMFNKDLSSWNVASATSMRGMFSGASAFSQVLCWNLNANVDVSGMFDDGSAAYVKGDCQPCLTGEYRIDTATCGTCPVGRFAAAPAGSG